jgi:hypothetical protein
VRFTKRCDTKKLAKRVAHGVAKLNPGRVFTTRNRRLWGAHAPRVLFLAPSPETSARCKILERSLYIQRGRRMLHARARALPKD